MTDDPAARIGALEEMLTEKGIIDAETVERSFRTSKPRSGR